MDITRNWRLKMTRSQILAARTPEGIRILEQSGVKPVEEPELYQFENSEPKNGIPVELPMSNPVEREASMVSHAGRQERL